MKIRFKDKRHHYDPPLREQAADLIDSLAWKAAGKQMWGCRSPGRPGEFIQALPAEQRRILGHLSSDDLATAPFPTLMFLLFAAR